MARFYAKFDGGSVSALDNVNGAGGYFTQRRIAATSASGALLRDGLIASRSAVSADVYDDLDSVNRNGNNGTYFPPDTPTFPTATLISLMFFITLALKLIKACSMLMCISLFDKILDVTCSTDKFW